MYTKAKQQGFSIIELLIVVAIIAILLLVALPQYQNYTIRAQVSEAISLSAGPKQALAVIAATDGEFTNESVGGIATGSGRYVETSTITAAADGNSATVQYEFGNEANSSIDGQEFILTGTIGTGTVTWACSAAVGDVDVANAIPSSCN